MRRTSASNPLSAGFATRLRPESLGSNCKFTLAIKHTVSFRASARWPRPGHQSAQPPENLGRDSVGQWKAMAGYWHAKLSSGLLAARKFNHILIVPEESGPILFQALSTLNQPEPVNESENSLRVK